MAGGDANGRLFLRAADQRLVDARTLLAAGRHAGAVYVGGYVVECVLKAVHLSHVPAGRQAAVLSEYRTARSHNYQHLVTLCERRGAVVPDAVLRVVRGSSWATDLRYNPGEVDARDAEAFVASAASVADWAARST